MDRKTIEKNTIEFSKHYKKMRHQMKMERYQGEYCSDHPDFWYCRILGLGKSWMHDKRPINQVISDLLVGLNAIDIPISFLIVGHNENISVYYGTTSGFDDIFFSQLKAVFPSMRIEREKTQSSGISITEFDDILEENDITGNPFAFSSVLRGNPSIEKITIEDDMPIDSLIKGMKGHTWIYSVCAEPKEKELAHLRNDEWMIEDSKVSELLNVSFSQSDNLENITLRKRYPYVSDYMDRIRNFSKKTQDEINCGSWKVTVQLAATSEVDLHIMEGLMAAALSGNDSKPEPVHAIRVERATRFLPGILSAEHYDYLEDLPYEILSNYCSSNELAVYMAYPICDTTGFSVEEVVNFDIAQLRTGNLPIGKIVEYDRKTAVDYSLDFNELNRHALIAGLTGSGKTNTTKELLYHAKKIGSIPIMVIEPTKKEYWELYKMGFDHLQIYSIGSFENNANPYRINPFECVDGTSVQTHIDFVFAAFKASFIMYPPMPYVLERAIYAIYEDYGWDVANNSNRYAKKNFPTIEDLYFKIPIVVTEMGYDHKMRNDLIGSLQARINSLRLGTKGETLNVKKSYDIEKILQSDVVIELEDIGDDDTKAFIISMILIQLSEYRRKQEDSQLQLRHLLLLEEAHRLLKNVASGTGENADPRGAAVEFFCNMLAELRSKGQGFIIADQIPSKLALDAVKNTNLKILHRTVAEDDRRLMGGAMHMTEEQIEALSSFEQGIAAVYSEGDHRPKKIKPSYAGDKMHPERKMFNRMDVLAAVQKNIMDKQDDYKSQTGLSVYALNFSPFYKTRYQEVFHFVNLFDFENMAEKLNPEKTGRLVPKEIDDEVRKFISQCDSSYQTTFSSAQFRACLKICLFDRWHFSEKKKQKFLKKIVFNN